MREIAIFDWRFILLSAESRPHACDALVFLTETCRWRLKADGLALIPCGGEPAWDCLKRMEKQHRRGTKNRNAYRKPNVVARMAAL